MQVLQTSQNCCTSRTCTPALSRYYPLTLQEEYDPGQPLHWCDEEVLQALSGTLRPRLDDSQEGVKAGILLVTAVQTLLAYFKVVDEGWVHTYQLVSL